MFTLTTPIEKIVGVGPTMAKRLHKVGIFTVADLLSYYPFRYEDFSKVKKIGQVKIGEAITIIGKVISIAAQKTPRKGLNITTALISDETGTIKAVWFNQPYLSKVLKKGQRIILAGKIGYGYNGGIELENPRFEIQNSKQILNPHFGRLVPIYPETKGLNSKFLRKIIWSFLPYVNLFEDFLPQEIKIRQKLMDLPRAIQEIHFPTTLALARAAKKRLAFDELFLMQLSLLKNRFAWQKEKAISLKFDKNLIKNFVEKLPFKLTDSQRKAAWEIIKDLEKNQPMNRLLEGDVGSGKTVVAAIAILVCTSNGFQAAYLAPTEVLAKQHFETLNNFLRKFNVKIALLLGSTKKKEKEEIIKKTKKGEINLLLGTHTLLEEKVQFKNLALAIIDEQHRFGVNQRAILRSKSNVPHLLSMSATPIPRSLALALYGDLDISVIKEMPLGRQEVITRIIPPEKREAAYEFIKKQVKMGRQAFVICPRIEANNLKSKIKNQKSKISGAEVKAVKEEYEKLAKKIFPDLKVRMLHGRMKSKEKEKIMEDFKKGKIDILVSTSVIEVGIDIPNATVMMIEGAERFGLAQLHQFRGRVGRSIYQSYCLLFTESNSPEILHRLQALAETKNGFELAEKDLQFRGPGELMGLRQHGFPDFKMASLLDVVLIKKAREEAERFLKIDPEFKNHPLLKKKLVEYHGTMGILN